MKRNNESRIMCVCVHKNEKFCDVYSIHLVCGIHVKPHHFGYDMCACVHEFKCIKYNIKTSVHEKVPFYVYTTTTTTTTTMTKYIV